MACCFVTSMRPPSDPVLSDPTDSLRLRAPWIDQPVEHHNSGVRRQYISAPHDLVPIAVNAVQPAPHLLAAPEAEGDPRLIAPELSRAPRELWRAPRVEVVPHGRARAGTQEHHAPVVQRVPVPVAPAKDVVSAIKARPPTAHNDTVDIPQDKA